MRNHLLEHALSYSALGWYVLPLRERGKEPFSKLAPQGFKSATTDPDKITEWWDAYPNLNVGIACAMSGLVVYDVDERNGGTMDGLATTLTIRTGDGFHLYYEAQDGIHYPGKLRQGVDIKFNGYVVAPPSIHPSGQIYRVVSADLQRRAAA